MLIDDIENHWNVLHYAIYYFNFTFVNLLLKFNTPLQTKLLNHKDKNKQIPYDLLFSYLTSFDNSVDSIDSNGEFQKLDNDSLHNNNHHHNNNYNHTSSLIVSQSSGDFINIPIYQNLLSPLPSKNPLLNFKISKFISTSSHSIIITSSGQLYITNPLHIIKKTALFSRIKFFDDLFSRGEKVIDASINNGHTVIITSFNKAYAFGINIQRLNLYQNVSSTTISSPHSKDLNSLTPIQIIIKQSSSISNTVTTPSSASSLTSSNMITNNFSALSLSSRSNTRLSIDDSTKSNTSQTIGVSSSDNHTVVYSPHSLHIYGLNLGQFGPLTNAIHTSDNSSKSISAHFTWKYPDDVIKFVLALDVATLIVTNSNLIHIYISGQHLKISLPSNTDISNNWNTFKPRILSSPRKIIKIIKPSINNSKDSGNMNGNYSVFLLLNTGEILLFTFPKYTISKNVFKSHLKFSTVWKPSRGEMNAIDFSIGELINGAIGAVLCTKSGEAFKRTKTKWVRINDVSNIYSVSIGFGISNGDSKNKIVLLRKENDSLKHKITSSSIISDIGSLSPLDGKNINSGLEYDTNFLSNRLEQDYIEEDYDDNDSDDEGDDNDDIENELVFTKRITPFAYQHNPLIYDYFHFEETLCDYLSNNCLFNKCYDYQIYIENTTTNMKTTINVHKAILFNRLNIEREKFHLDRKKLTFEFNENDGFIIGEMDIRSVVIFINMLYNDEILDVWNNGITDPTIKTGWDRLLYTFPKIPFFECMNKLNGGDITVKLANNVEIKTWKFLLIARCDYFKQLFSNNWMEIDIVDFSHVKETTWNLLMKYFQGEYNDDIFYSNVKELIKGKDTVDDFINFMIDLIYLSNELLIPELKHLCELAIKDCINFENYDIILQHAFISSSKQLFSNCVWYIFNNLPITYKDSRINNSNLSDECMKLIDLRIKELIYIYLPKRKLKKRSNMGTIFTDSYNEYYLHPYLWSVEGVTKETISKHESLTTRRKSQISKPLPLTKVEPETVNNINNNENAIEEGDSNEFIVVQRRRSSVKTSRPIINKLPTPPTTPISIIPNPMTASSTSVSSSAPSPSLIIPTTSSKKTVKIKLTPRLSQKERLQKEREEKEKEKEQKERERELEKENRRTWTPNNAWGNTTPKVIEGNSNDLLEISTATIIAPKKLTGVHFPSLDEMKRKKSVEKVIINEVIETKSIEDIKAEEEFARWWEEESKRVQEEMERGNGNGSTRGRGNGKTRGGRGGGRGRGRVRGRGRGKSS